MLAWRAGRGWSLRWWGGVLWRCRLLTIRIGREWNGDEPPVMRIFHIFPKAPSGRQRTLVCKKEGGLRTNLPFMFSIEGLVLEAGLVAMMNATMTAKIVQVATREKVDRSRKCMKYVETVQKLGTKGNREVGYLDELRHFYGWSSNLPLLMELLSKSSV